MGSTSRDIEADDDARRLEDIKYGNGKTWEQRALQLVLSDEETEKKEFVDEVLDRLLVHCVRSGGATVHVERGLSWTMNDVDIVDEFKDAIDAWQMFAPSQGPYGAVHVDIGGKIIDSATITNTDQLGSVQMAPCQETQQLVDVFLEFSCVFSPRGKHSKAHFTVQSV